MQNLFDNNFVTLNLQFFINEKINGLFIQFMLLNQNTLR